MNHEKIILATLCCMWRTVESGRPLDKNLSIGVWKDRIKRKWEVRLFVAQEDDPLEITAGGIDEKNVVCPNFLLLNSPVFCEEVK